MVAEGRSHASVAFVQRLSCAIWCSLGFASLSEHLTGGWLRDGRQGDCGHGLILVNAAGNDCKISQQEKAGNGCIGKLKIVERQRPVDWRDEGARCEEPHP